MYRYCSSSRRYFYWRRCEIETWSLNLPILSSCSLVSSSLFRLLCSRRKRFESRGFSLFRVLNSTPSRRSIATPRRNLRSRPRRQIYDQLSFLRGWISPIFELIVRVAKHSTQRQRSQRFQVHLTRPFLVVFQIEVVRIQNRVRRDQRFVRYIIAERAGQNERQSCMFTSYRRRRSTNGSVILRIDIDDIECYIILLSGRRLLLRDIQFLSPLSSVDLASCAFVCVFLKKTQSSTLTVLFLFFFEIVFVSVVVSVVRRRFSVLGRFASRFGGGVSRTRFCEGAPQHFEVHVFVTMMSSPKSSVSCWSSALTNASDFTESHAERACKEAKSTCAGADLPPEKRSLLNSRKVRRRFWRVRRHLRSFVGFTGGGGRWTLSSKVKTLIIIERFAFFLSFFLSLEEREQPPLSKTHVMILYE